MKRLSNATLALLAPGIRRPGYDPGSVLPGIVHLGAGAFHRAHQALLTDSVLAGGSRRWGIVAANLRSSALQAALGPQDGLYTVEESGAGGRRLRVIGALRGVAAGQEDPAGLVALMAGPDIRIVPRGTDPYYGAIPDSLFLELRDAIIAKGGAVHMRTIKRTE